MAPRQKGTKRDEYSMSSAAREPNFFIVGAPKAGTTSLYHYLDQHPDIYMSPIKEPCFFSSEIRPENFEAHLRPRTLQLEENCPKVSGWRDGQ